GDQSGANRIVPQDKDDRDDRCRLLYCRRSIVIRDNEIDLEAQKLSHELGNAVGATCRPAILDRNGSILDPAEVVQSRCKSCRPWPPGRRVGAHKTDRRQLARLLRARRERPRGHAAEQRDERAAVHHSITSSARPRSIGGTSRPSAFAVLRLITSSYLVGCCTGKSAGFVPRRMRST